MLCNVFCFPTSSNSARLPQFAKLTTSKQQFKDVTKRQSNFVRPGFFQKWNVLYTICYILYSMLYLISVFQYYIRISDKSNLILQISNPASDFMFCLLIIIMIVYLFWRDCNYNYSNCSRTLLILNLILFFWFSIVFFFCAFCFFLFLLFCCFFLLFVCSIFCFFFAFWFAFFLCCFFVLQFFTFFTNKLIFKFIGFWLTGEHKVNAMQLSFGMFKLGAMPDHTMKSGMPPAKRKENVTSTSVWGNYMLSSSARTTHVAGSNTRCTGSPGSIQSAPHSRDRSHLPLDFVPCLSFPLLCPFPLSLCWPFPPWSLP